MEVKKSKKADLENRRGLFMEIGLIVALAAVIIMFSVSQREKVVEVMAPVATVDEVEMIDVTTEKEPEPEPVQHQQTVAVITDVLNVVRNDTKIETSIGWVDFEDEDIEIAPIQVETEEIEEETIFIVADQKPSFQGGDLNVFRNWVQARLSYPPLAQENNIQGTVTVKFVVEKADQHTGTEEPRQDALGRSGKRTVQISEMGARPSARRAGAFQLHDAYRIQTPELTIPIR